VQFPVRLLPAQYLAARLFALFADGRVAHKIKREVKVDHRA
jgi:hypothetical protein